MGLIARMRAAAQLSGAAGPAATVLRNAAEALATDAEAERARRGGRFHGFVDGVNRLPRPLLALGTLALFGYAMAEPAGFSLRMEALGRTPEPLWWLLGGVVSFYFGARELHYLRETAPAAGRALASPATEDAAAAEPDAPAAEAAEPVALLGGRWPGRAPAPRPRPGAARATPAAVSEPAAAPVATPVAAPAPSAGPDGNAALEEWRRLRA
jgi:hypothetical protein